MRKILIILVLMPMSLFSQDYKYLNNDFLPKEVDSLMFKTFMETKLYKHVDGYQPDTILDVQEEFLIIKESTYNKYEVLFNEKIYYVPRYYLYNYKKQVIKKI